MIRWIIRWRVRQLRKAKLVRVERFKLAFDHGDHAMATKHRRMIDWYVRRIAELTGEPEWVHTKGD